MEDPGFWDNADRANKKMKELKNLKDTVSECNGLKTQYEDIETLIEMGYEADDAEMIPEIREEMDSFIEKFETLRISTLLSEEAECRCRRYRELRLGRYAVSYVYQMGRAQGLFHRSAGLSGW